jgi:HD-like signal output (HDOD) protein/FixJ family two-component response regulator
MKTILVVDDMQVFREPIAAALKMTGYNIITAQNGKIALGLIRENRPDLVLLDIAMPVMDGLAVLRAMKADPSLCKIPVILLTAVCEKSYIAQAAKMGIRDYMLKSNFSLEELMGRVKKHLNGNGAPASPGRTQAQQAAPAAQAAQVQQATPASSPAEQSSAPGETQAPAGTQERICITEGTSPSQSLNELEPVLSKSEVFRFVKEGLELKPLAATVHNVLAVTSSSSCTADDVADKVVHDQGLSIRILKLANSSAYSRGKPSNGIKQAISRIGIQQVRNLVMTLGVLEQYEGGISKYVDPRLFWEHSIGCGLVASSLAELSQKKVKEDYFLLGMLHDVGRLILVEHVPEAYSKVFQAARDLKLPMHTVENKMMEINHCDILKQALEQWRMPKEFIGPVINHHLTFEQTKHLGPDQAQSAAIVNTANRISHALLLGNSGSDLLYPFDDFVEFLEITAFDFEKMIAEIPNETNNLKFTMLAHSTSGGAWPEYYLEIKERLPDHFRPLCVSEIPSMDAYKILFDRICDSTEEISPNLGIIYLRNAKDADKLFQMYEEQEKQGHSIALPVIIIYNKGKFDTENNWLANRDYAVFRAPISVNNMLGAINQLLGVEEAVTANA